jgi:ABC-type antimicrobial peptide transport system permease subunit
MAKNKKLNQKTIIIGLTAALIFAILGILCFSYAMETLDLKAGELGLEEQPIYDPPFPDYSITILEGKWGDIIIGVVFTLLLFVVTFVVAKLLSKKRDTT